MIKQVNAMSLDHHEESFIIKIFIHPSLIKEEFCKKLNEFKGKGEEDRDRM